MREQVLDSQEAGDVICLCQGVERVSRPGYLLLVSPHGNAMRVSSTVEQYWQLLETGVRLEALIGHMQSRYPGDLTAQRVKEFVGKLRACGLLEDFAEKSVTIDRWAIDLDQPARIVAKVLGWIPAAVVGTCCLAVAITSLTLFAQTLVSRAHPHFMDMARQFSWVGLAICLLLLVPLHEFAHSVACRLVGVRAGKMVLDRGALGLPRVFLRTPAVALLQNRWKRVLVACSGLFIELSVGGLAAWGMLHNWGGAILHRAEVFVFLYCLMCLTTGTSPIQESDGSHALEALFSDDSLRVESLISKKSRFTKPGNVRTYRIICIIHVLLSITFLRFMLV